MLVFIVCSSIVLPRSLAYTPERMVFWKMSISADLAGIKDCPGTILLSLHVYMKYKCAYSEGSTLFLFTITVSREQTQNICSCSFSRSSNVSRTVLHNHGSKLPTMSHDLNWLLALYMSYSSTNSTSAVEIVSNVFCGIHEVPFLPLSLIPRQHPHKLDSWIY